MAKSFYDVVMDAAKIFRNPTSAQEGGAGSASNTAQEGGAGSASNTRDVSGASALAALTGGRGVMAAEPMGHHWPGRFDTGSDARRYGWAAYVLGTLAIAEMGVILIQQATIWEMMPLKQYVPYVVTVGTDSAALADVRPLQFGMPGFRAMTVTWIADYVMKRNTITSNPLVMERIASGDVGFVALRSTEDVYKAWANASRPFVKKAMKAGLERVARITAINALEQDTPDGVAPPLPWSYIVEYEIADSLPAQEATPDGAVRQVVERRFYRATLSVSFKNRGKIAITDLYDPDRSNAVGFTVFKIDEVEVKK
jgi:hypothetical protein